MTQPSGGELPGTDKAAAEQAADDITLSTSLAAEHDQAAIDLSPPDSPEAGPVDKVNETDGARYARRHDEVVVQLPQTGPATLRQQASHDALSSLAVYGSEPVPVLRDGGKLARASAGLLTDRVDQLSGTQTLKPEDDVVVWVIDDHGLHAKVFLDTLRATNEATYNRTRVVLINTSAEILTTIQDKNVLAGHERVDYRAARNLASLRPSGQEPLAILAPDLPNRQPAVYQIFNEGPAAENGSAPKGMELQRGIKVSGDTPLVTIDPDSGLSDVAVLDNFYGLHTDQSAEGRSLILRLDDRIQETVSKVAIAETPLRRNERSTGVALEGLAEHQLHNFVPPQDNPINTLLDRLQPHGMLLTGGFINNGRALQPEQLRRIEDKGAVATYTAELDALDTRADAAHLTHLSRSKALSTASGYGYILYDTSPDASLMTTTAEQFKGQGGVNAPEVATAFLKELGEQTPPDEPDAPSIYESLLEKYPQAVGNYDLAVEAARLLIKEGRPEEAVTVAESAIQYAPHVCTTALIEAGRAYVTLGQIADAKRMFKWALELSPHAAPLHAEMMSLSRREKDWDNLILATGRYIRDARGLKTPETIKLMKGIITAAEKEKKDCAENPFPYKTVIVESVWIDKASGEPQIEREVRYLPRWLMAQIKAADLSSNYADTVRRLLDYADDMPQEDKVATVEWFNQKYELHCLRADPDDPDSWAGERELWPDRSIRALWPDLSADRTHRLIYTGDSTLVDDELASPQPLLNMVALEQDPASKEAQTEQLRADEQDRVRAAHIELGLVPDPFGRRPSTLYAPLDLLNRHVLIVGETGSGKSNACRNILEELTVAGVPWLVIEASKSEYGSMAGRLEGRADVFVISPGDPDAIHEIPAALNFLEPEPGFPILSHIDMVQDALLAAFQGDEPFPQVMSQALVRVYETHGWDMATGLAVPGALRPPTIPTLEDLVATAMEIIGEKGYANNRGNVEGFVRMRIESLGVGSLGKFLEGPNGFDFADLQSRNVVLCLNNMGDDKMKTFLTAMFLAKRNQYLNMRNKQERQARSGGSDDQAEGVQGLRHFTMIEEASRLLKYSSNSASNSAVSKIAGSFALLRADREGIGAVCQSIDGLHNDVMRNTALKIVLRTQDGEDQVKLARMMSLEDDQAHIFGALKTGQAYVYRSEDRSPVPIFTSDGSSREREIPNHTPPPIRGRHTPIRQASGYEIHEAEIAVGAATPEGAWMRSWVEFMTMAYVAGKKLPDAPEPLRAHAASLSPQQRRLQIRHAAGNAVTRRSSVMTTFDPMRLQASIESAASDMLEHNIGAGTLPPKEFAVPQLQVLNEDQVVHLPFYRGLKPDPDDIAPPLQHHIPRLDDYRHRRATFGERSESIGRHPLSMRHPNQRVSNRNARIGFIALFGTDGSQQLFDEDLALATGENNIHNQELAMTRAMRIGGGPGTVGWGLEVLSLPKRVFSKQVAKRSKTAA